MRESGTRANDEESNVSLVIAFMGRSASRYRMPLDYDLTISRSIPFAIAFTVVSVFGWWRLEARAMVAAGRSQGILLANLVAAQSFSILITIRTTACEIQTGNLARNARKPPLGDSVAGQ